MSRLSLLVGEHTPTYFDRVFEQVWEERFIDPIGMAGSGIVPYYDAPVGGWAYYTLGTHEPSSTTKRMYISCDFPPSEVRRVAREYAWWVWQRAGCVNRIMVIEQLRQTGDTRYGVVASWDPPATNHM